MLIAILIAVCTVDAAFAQEQVDDAIKQLQSSDGSAQMEAAQLLGDFGPLARNAVPALVQVLKSTEDVALRQESIIALGRIGTTPQVAVPALMASLADKSEIVRYSALHSLRMYGDRAKSALNVIRPLTASRSELERVAAARALAAIDADDPRSVQVAVPVLLEALKSPVEEVRADAIFGLAGIGKPVVKSLAEIAGSSSPDACASACGALAEIGPDAAAAVPVLVKKLADDDDRVSRHAAKTIGAIGASPDISVPALAGLLTHASVQNRIHAAYSIGRFGPEAGSAVPALVKALSDEDTGVRIAAAEALGAIRTNNQSALAALDKSLDDPEGAVTISAASALSRIGAAAVPRLVKRLDDEKIRLLIAHVLGEIGPDASEAAPALAKQLSSDDPNVRVEAMVALSEMGPAARAAAPELMRIVKSPGSTGRAAAVYALAKMEASEVVPLLKETMNAEDERLRIASILALAQFMPDNPDYVRLAMPGLIKGIDDESPQIRSIVAQSLGQFGERAASGIPALARHIGDPVPHVRSDVLGAIARIGTDDPEVIDAIVKRTDDQIALVRYTAAYAIGKLRVVSALPHVRRMLDSRDPFERVVGAWAVAKIDRNPETARLAIPVLITALKHERPSVRLEVVDLLGDIGGNSQDVRQALTDVAADDADASVRKAADAAVKKLKK